MFAIVHFLKRNGTKRRNFFQAGIKNNLRLMFKFKINVQKESSIARINSQTKTNQYKHYQTKQNYITISHLY